MMFSVLSLFLLLPSPLRCLDERHEIAIGRCTQDSGMFCFTPPHCITTATQSTANALQRVTETAAIEKDCDVFLMFRRYTLSKVRVLLWAPSASARFRVAGGKIAFGCEANVEKRVEGRSDGHELTILRSELDEHRIFCDFIVNSLSNASHVIPATPSLAKFETSRGEFAIEPKSIVDLFKDYGGCDPDSLTWDSRIDRDGGVLFNLTDDSKYEKKVKCPGQQSPVLLDYRLTSVAKSIACDYSEIQKKWIYKAFYGEYIALDKFPAACRTKLCGTCGKTSFRCVGDKCKTPEYNETQCDYKCPSNRIQVNDQPATLGAPYCALVNDDYRWHFGGEVIRTATCVEQVDCRTTSPLNCTNCHAIHTKLDKVVCKLDEDLKVRRGGSFESVSHLSCDKAAGKWISEDYEGKSTELERGAEVKCGDWHLTPAAACTTVVVTCAIFVVFMLAAAAAWFILRTRFAKKILELKAKLTKPVKRIRRKKHRRRKGSKSKSRSRSANSKSKSKSSGPVLATMKGQFAPAQQTPSARPGQATMKGPLAPAQPSPLQPAAAPSANQLRFRTNKPEDISKSRTARSHFKSEERKKRKEEAHKKKLNMMTDRLTGIIKAKTSERQTSSKAEKKYAKKAPANPPAAPPAAEAKQVSEHTAKTMEEKTKEDKKVPDVKKEVKKDVAEVKKEKK